MGCDIHAMIERREVNPYKAGELWSYWQNAGESYLERNYQIFAVLAGVRSNGIPAIAEPRGCPEDATNEFDAWYDSWGADAHSCSHVTLAEMKAYDVTQEWYDTSLILQRDADGKITSTCAWTTGAHMGPVGRTTVFGTWGTGAWDALIASLEAVKAATHTDQDVRLCFFFDN